MRRIAAQYLFFTTGKHRTCMSLLLLAVLALLPALVVQAEIIYVDCSATPPGNGDSWATAYTDLQFALQTASSVGDEIRERLGPTNQLLALTVLLPSS
jgi:hypothetical protein